MHAYNRDLPNALTKTSENNELKLAAVKLCSEILKVYAEND